MKKIEINTFLDFQFVSNPSFSPDGKYIAFVVSTADQTDNNYKANLYVYNMESHQVLPLTSSGDARSYTWSNKNTLLFSAVRDNGIKKRMDAGEELASFYEISPNGGEAIEAFTIPAKATSIKSLSDGCFLLTIKHDNYKDTRKKSYEVFDELPFWGNGLGYTNAIRNRYAIYNPQTEDLTYLADSWTDCLAHAVLGDQIVYKAFPWKQGIRGIYAGLYLYNRKTGETKTLIEPDSLRTGIFEFLNEEELLLTASETNDMGCTKYNDFYIFNLLDGTLTLKAEYDASVGGGSVGCDARYGGGRTYKMVNGECYFISTIHDYAWLRKLDQNFQISDSLTNGSSCDSFDFNGEHLVTCELQGQKLAELYLDGKQITNFNGALLSELSVSIPEPLTFTASDGYEIHGWVMKPANYQEGISYPAIFHIHGGPRTVFSDVFHHEMQVWANAGYFVFYCNPRGSDGRGTAFGDIKGIYGTVDYKNLMEFTDRVLETYPMIDSKRVGVTGGSYGGFMTNWIIGHTDRFAAAATQRSICNWVAFEHTSDIGHTFVYSNVGGDTIHNLEALWEQSPLKYAPNFKTPTLIIHSDEDYRCYMVDGISMFSALKRQGVPTKLCLFHGENHELSRGGRPENRIDRMTEILNWMDTYLK